MGSDVKITTFDVLKEMGNRNMRSMKGFGLGNVKSARMGKRHSTVEIVVDPNTAYAVMTQKPIRFMLIVADDEDFKRVEEELKTRGLPPLTITPDPIVVKKG